MKTSIIIMAILISACNTYHQTSEYSGISVDKAGHVFITGKTSTYYGTQTTSVDQWVAVCYQTIDLTTNDSLECTELTVNGLTRRVMYEEESDYISDILIEDVNLP